MSFEELHQKLSPTIKRIAWRLNGHSRSFSHDDLYQEASIYLWSNFVKGKLCDKTDSYILQGCYFHLKNYIRKINERSNIISIDAALSVNEEATIEDILGKYWSCEDCRFDLHNKFLAQNIQNNGFNSKEKKLFKYFSQGLTTREIGRHMGISHVSVVKMTQKIRAKAQKYLDKI
ncbi:MAG: sigma-70 family RNA polymerase sigma factor [Candidatus Omnitrophica bacterium]|jgi:RNA polymerase sigma factor (sigma-70 family)|nr:sigma-70 family RNA polymerase sigma factor [Candidatus Omnitrophota bacterium]MDD5661030.1 sigma-70 family RNA polymerase sigma factor [Candidatus Omnitrophota bacterium]